MAEDSSHRKLLSAMAERWFRSDSRAEGSFEFVCEVFNLDPVLIRRRVFGPDPRELVRQLRGAFERAGYEESAEPLTERRISMSG